ncbi:MAG: YjjG family noncanonical pyrimidine nucleotidase [Candidatus Faecousia sp.]|nr:YjjG family noncanonical pyrimidine nucleotidase [Candidatus Faecousia sp.]
MYKFLFLDLDDTLLDFGAAEDVAIRRTFREVGIEPTEKLIARYKQINAAQWERYERGEIPRAQVLTERYDLLFAEFGIHMPGWKCEDVYRKYLGIGHYFVPGAVELRDYLRGRGYRLFLASNGVAATQNSRLDSAGIRPYFEDIFISETTGSHKPDRRYFDYCFSHISGFEKDAALLIGDSLSSDIRGGKNAGIHTCWFNPGGRTAPPELQPDYQISSLDELRRIL